MWYKVHVVWPGPMSMVWCRSVCLCHISYPSCYTTPQSPDGEMIDQVNIKQHIVTTFQSTTSASWRRFSSHGYSGVEQAGANLASYQLLGTFSLWIRKLNAGSSATHPLETPHPTRLRSVTMDYMCLQPVPYYSVLDSPLPCHYLT